MKKTPEKKKTGRPKLDTLKVTITELDNEGVGTAREDNLTALVQGAFPAETVVAEVEHRGRTHIFTRLLKILRRSPSRTAQPGCPVELSCLGCPLVSMQYQAQLQFKQQRLERALTALIPIESFSALPVLPAVDTLGYRTSAKLVFARQREKLLLGLYRRGSHDVVDIAECPVHHPLINRIATIVREDVARRQVSVYNPRHQRGLLRYLLIRVSPDNNRALVTFVCHDRDYQNLPKLAKKLIKKVPEVIGVHQNINSSSGNVILGNESIKLLGHPDLIEQVGDIRLHIAPESFFQVNTRQATRMYALITDWAALSGRETVVDLFCGIGGIALSLAKGARHVIGIEIVPEAVRNAKANATLNQLSNCRFIAGDAMTELERLAGTPDLVTVNPPRKGCGAELIRHIVALRPAQIIYVSCDPDTLAQDLKQLLAGGYQIKRLQPVDMFPQTAHIETLVQLVAG
ncbi:23S rRNA (uracil(1939)-C(5))-methyltransferase RlmD [Pelobacter sp. M08fum]|uniref:23S rRNA (Uracil(1939)-C(5))-methyltransferase RlmD n=2 Tax=Pelovirga terrestris TaxID=2771352 RepID=A0A8J6QWV1_9BACT|nr:23S rRNA (uracil(1939)-C(5))-methyltransferase RlmD [Pelovirga terrestris]